MIDPSVKVVITVAPHEYEIIMRALSVYERHLTETYAHMETPSREIAQVVELKGCLNN